MESFGHVVSESGGKNAMPFCETKSGSFRSPDEIVAELIMFNVLKEYALDFVLQGPPAKLIKLRNRNAVSS
ncbi:hypothetical protein S2091_0487 [Solimicrobium silvestre]|uniref:Uncharacterized protein n=1 Tax=Solimicrobium silvestre TaxID=2099400 RepID=A0A2S9H3C1_9BURK|nr:hypothetical protein S2091_0487 [Solimicrobium silvestre]